MKKIFCIEGEHDVAHPGWTIEPMLELLQRNDSWEYQHRFCATIQELQYLLQVQWNECAEGSLLYFFTHGAKDQIWLSGTDQAVGLLTLKEWINGKGCHIHFGGCDTFSGGEHNLGELLEYTKASSVSGYATSVGWFGEKAPAVSLELEFLGLMYSIDLAKNTKGRARRLANITKKIDTRFPDCKFKMLTRSFKNRVK